MCNLVPAKNQTAAFVRVLPGRDEGVFSDSNNISTNFVVHSNFKNVHINNDRTKVAAGG